VRDLGVWTDRGLSMSTHVTKVVAGCFAVLRQLNSISRSVSRESLIGLVVSLVLTRLDYCNAVLVGLPAPNSSISYAKFPKFPGIQTSPRGSGTPTSIGAPLVLRLCDELRHHACTSTGLLVVVPQLLLMLTIM